MPSSTHRARFGARVRSLREEHGMSQESFAHLAGLDRTYVSGIERGRRNPTLEVIVQLADALDVSPAELFRQQS
ncbi:helix-turn-helix domain-containing protein [Microbacterium sp. AGC85]